jgi:hypothetical protein
MIYMRVGGGGFEVFGFVKKATGYGTEKNVFTPTYPSEIHTHL